MATKIIVVPCSEKTVENGGDEIVVRMDKLDPHHHCFVHRSEKDPRIDDVHDAELLIDGGRPFVERFRNRTTPLESGPRY
jgi:hypothetical protein